MRLEGASASKIASELNRLGILSPLAYKKNNGLPYAKKGYADKADCIWKGSEDMGKKGTPHRKYSKEEKMRYVRLHLEDHISVRQIERDYGIGNALVLALGQHELGIGHTAITLIAGDEPAVVCLLRICHIVDNIADSTAFGPALADVQRHDSCGCHEFSLPSKKVGSLSCPLHQNMK